VWNAIVMPWWHRITLLGSAAASLEAPKLHPRAMAGLWAGCCMGVGVSQAQRGRRLGVRHAVRMRWAQKPMSEVTLPGQPSGLLYIAPFLGTPAAVQAFLADAKGLMEVDPSDATPATPGAPS